MWSSELDLDTKLDIDYLSVSVCLIHLSSSNLINSWKWSQIKVNTCHNLFRHEQINNETIRV